MAEPSRSKPDPMDSSASMDAPKRGFRVRFKPWSMILALLAGVGYLVLLQQYGLMVITTGKLLMAAAMGLVAGVLLPTLATLIPHKQRPKPSAKEGM